MRWDGPRNRADTPPAGMNEGGWNARRTRGRIKSEAGASAAGGNGCVLDGVPTGCPGRHSGPRKGASPERPALRGPKEAPGSARGRGRPQRPPGREPGRPPAGPPELRGIRWGRGGGTVRGGPPGRGAPRRGRMPPTQRKQCAVSGSASWERVYHAQFVSGPEAGTSQRPDTRAGRHWAADTKGSARPPGGVQFRRAARAGAPGKGGTRW